VYGNNLHHNNRERGGAIEHNIALGVDIYNNWVQQPDNASERNKDDKMIPYLKDHFIYIDYATSMYHVGSGKVTNVQSCVMIFIRNTIPDEKGIHNLQRTIISILWQHEYFKRGATD
jgi:hypothetical protein